jgi:hypothetical protein
MLGEIVMKREAKIVKIIDKISKTTDERVCHRLGKEGYLYTDSMHTGFSFLFEYKEGSILSGSTIMAVRRFPNYIIVVTKHTVYIFKYLELYKSFYERYKEHEVTINDINDFIDEWHNENTESTFYKEIGLSDEIIRELYNSGDTNELNKYLGLTEEQYSNFRANNKLD